MVQWGSAVLCYTTGVQSGTPPAGWPTRQTQARGRAKARIVIVSISAMRVLAREGVCSMNLKREEPHDGHGAKQHGISRMV